jgi:hypothetical protein
LAGRAGGLERRVKPGIEYLLALFRDSVHSSNVRVVDRPAVLGILHGIAGDRIDARELVGENGNPNTRTDKGSHSFDGKMLFLLNVIYLEIMRFDFVLICNPVLRLRADFERLRADFLKKPLFIAARAICQTEICQTESNPAVIECESGAIQREQMKITVRLPVYNNVEGFQVLSGAENRFERHTLSGMFSMTILIYVK